MRTFANSVIAPAALIVALAASGCNVAASPQPGLDRAAAANSILRFLDARAVPTMLNGSIACNTSFTFPTAAVTDERVSGDTAQVEAVFTSVAKEDMTATNIMPSGCLGVASQFVNKGQTIRVRGVFHFQRWSSGWRVVSFGDQ